MPGGTRPVAGPADDRRLAGLIKPVVASAGMDLESVRTTIAGRRRLLRVVVDSDHGVSLDSTDAMGDVPYTLEVSSPGVDRPLTEPRHWRRAAGRLVRVKASAEGIVQGRVLAADADGVTMDINGAARRFTYGDLGAGAVQVEFGRVPEAEPEELSDGGLSDEELPSEADLGAGGDGH
jgi:ribosome maturation factor RimP